MGAVKGDRGQALLLVVVALGISAAVIVGLRYAQDRVVTVARVQRAGEAAVEAAAAAVADRYIRDRGSAKNLPHDDRVLEDARAAAQDLARKNGGGAIDSLAVTCTQVGLEVSLVMNGHTHRAGFDASECSQP